MSQMTITLNDELTVTLHQLALENKLTDAQYASNIVNVFLEDQYRGAYLKKVQDSKVEDLKKLDPIVLNPKLKGV